MKEEAPNSPERAPKGRLRNQIYFCVLPLLALFMILLGYSTYSAVKLNMLLQVNFREVQQVRNETLDIVEFLSRAQGVMLELAFVTENPDLNRIESTYSMLISKRSSLSLPSDPELRAITRNFHLAIDNYLSRFDEAIYILENNPSDYTMPIRQLHAETEVVIRQLSDYYEVLSKSTTASLNRVAQFGKFAVYILGGGMMLGVLGTLLASRQLNTLIAEPIESLRQRLDKVAKGDLSLKQYDHDAVELEHLENAYAHMVRRLRTYRELTDKRLLALTSTFRTVMHRFPNPLYLRDSHGKIIYQNAAAKRLNDKNNHEGELPREILEFLKDRSNEEKVLIMKDPDEAIPILRGEKMHYFLLNLFPINLAGLSEEDDMNKESQTGNAYLLQDVTLSRLSNDLKSNLLETVSHELKTPITSARLALYLLADANLGTLEAKQEELVNSAKQDLDRLLTTIQNLLDLTRIRNRAQEPDINSLNLNSVVRQCTVKYAEMAETRDVKIQLDEKDKDLTVQGDEKRLSVVLNNFLSNALKHSDPGSVINVNVKGLNGHTRVEVVDHGQGMPKHLEKRIFDKFSSPSEIINAGGGIGLHIAREIVEEHNGQIGCSCAPEGGCTFFFELPRAKEEA